MSVFACFVAAYAVRPSGWIALMCASLYAFVPGSMYRNIATFIREDFALPFLFGSYACFLMCLKEDRRSVASMGAVLLFIALAAWHVSQFFIQLFAVGLVLLIVFHGFQILPRRALAIYTVAMVAASITLPVLREKTFVFSIPLMMCYPIVGLAWLRPGGDGWPAWKRIATAGGAMLVFVLIALSIQWFTGTHSHVYAVMLAKLRYLGQLPEDPTLLSFQAKMMWTSSFLTLSWREIWILYSSTLIFAAIALVAVGNQLLRGQHGPSLTMTLYLAAVTFVLAILINRMTIFAVFFLAVFVVFAWPRERRSWRFACGALLVVCLTCEVLRYANSSVLPSFQFVPVRPEPVAVNEITRYLRTHTNPGQAVLTTIELSPHIAEYADRPRFEPKAELQHDLRVLAAQGLANAYMGNLSRAEAIMRQAQKSGMWQVDMFLGDMLSLAQKYEEAESQFQAALRKNPQSALIYANLGRNRARQKKFPEAIEALENSLELNPNQPAVANFLANVRKLAETPDGH